jgi:hypothetical protein
MTEREALDQLRISYRAYQDHLITNGLAAAQFDHVPTYRAKSIPGWVYIPGEDRAARAFCAALVPQWQILQMAIAVLGGRLRRARSSDGEWLEGDVPASQLDEALELCRQHGSTWAAPSEDMLATQGPHA